ncbi:hypothetical protein [Peribacillus glennii]|nr:hypothetical protein [Peribacillus glennii]
MKSILEENKPTGIIEKNYDGLMVRLLTLKQIVLQFYMRVKKRFYLSSEI